MPLPPVESPPTPGPIEVKLGLSPDAQAAVFSSPFRIGRAVECEIRISNEFVSRQHAEVTPQANGWLVKDLNSSNGIYWNGERVDSVLVRASEIVRLGVEGPELWFYVQRLPEPVIPDFKGYTPGPKLPAPEPRVFTPLKPVISEARPHTLSSPPAVPDATVQATSEHSQRPRNENMEQFVQKYFRETREGEVVGEHTGYIRRAFTQIQTEQKKKHTKQKRVLWGTIGGLALVGLLVGAYAIRLQREARHQRDLARNLFYSMKSLDVEIAAAEQAALSADKATGQATVKKYEARRQDIQSNYDQFLATLKIYDPKSTEQHRLILRVARIFGECELDMPPEFENEVNNYIQKWKSTGRYAHAIKVAKEKGFTRSIPEALWNRGLPPQFFYLAMQESDFDPLRSGPITYKGYAKGMWQFIPETAVKYGLHLGPLVDLPRPDPADERNNAEKETEAAAQYIQMLYSTDAQASGLLVMACYNWGEPKVLPLVRSMPPSPKDRNFWKFLAEHRSQIPPETYNYVFYIISAAVIGENPRLFGFDFDNPLESSH